MGLFIGLDPGVNGGAACVDQNGKPVSTVAFSKVTPVDLWEWLYDYSGIVGNPNLVAVYLENVSSSPQMGVVSAFTFGRGFGKLEGFGLAICQLRQARFNMVRPATWQAKLKCRSKGNKNVTKARAQQLFPSIKMTHAIADALLIAEYARLTELGR